MKMVSPRFICVFELRLNIGKWVERLQTKEVHMNEIMRKHPQVLFAVPLCLFKFVKLWIAIRV